MTSDVSHNDLIMNQNDLISNIVQHNLYKRSPFSLQNLVIQQTTILRLLRYLDVNDQIHPITCKLLLVKIFRE